MALLGFDVDASFSDVLLDSQLLMLHESLRDTYCKNRVPLWVEVTALSYRFVAWSICPGCGCVPLSRLSGFPCSSSSAHHVLMFSCSRARARALVANQAILSWRTEKTVKLGTRYGQSALAALVLLRLH